VSGAAPGAEGVGGAAPPRPDPAAHPVVLFDGVCNLCNGVVRFVVERDPAGRFHFAPLQSEVARALAARHGFDATRLDAVLLVDADGAHDRSSAALRIAAGLRPPWRWLAVLRVVPRPVRDAVYDWIARHRYRWFGRRDTCAVASPALRSRFLA